MSAFRSPFSSPFQPAFAGVFIDENSPPWASIDPYTYIHCGDGTYCGQGLNSGDGAYSSEGYYCGDIYPYCGRQSLN